MLDDKSSDDPTSGRIRKDAGIKIYIRQHIKLVWIDRRIRKDAGIKIPATKTSVTALLSHPQGCGD